jgi:hypothetical protein
MARPLRVLIVVAVVAGFRIIEAQPGVPGTPTSLVVTVGGNLVSLEWSPPSIGGAISTYVIEAGSLSGSADLAAFATGGTATRFVTSAPPGLYFVRVRARNSVGMSGASNEAQVLVGGSCTLPGGWSDGLSELGSCFGRKLLHRGSRIPSRSRRSRDDRYRYARVDLLSDGSIWHLLRTDSREKRLRHRHALQRNHGDGRLAWISR